VGGRCKRHGGASTPHKPATHIKRAARSLARGLYTDMLFPWEEDMYGACKTGTLEEELRLLRVQLRRAVIAQHNYDTVMEHLGEFRENPDAAEIPPELFKHLELDGYEFTQAKKEEGEEEVKKMLRRKRDYRREIQQWVKLIGALEVQHQALAASDLFGGGTLERMAEDLRAFAENAKRTIGESE
jgi:hypothetical protein